MSAESSLVVDAVSKSFGHLRVLRKTNVRFGPGEIVLLLGANGAGKSTLLRILAGLSRADSGKVHNTFAGAVGFSSHQLLLYNRLTARENLRLFSRVQGSEIGSTALTSWDLEAVADTQVADLSKGNQARVSLARAFLSCPAVILLDEPSSNLDERGTRILMELVLRTRDDRRGDSVTLIATHDIHRLRPFTTRVLVLDQGRISADSGPKASEHEIDGVIAAYREANR